MVEGNKRIHFLEAMLAEDPKDTFVLFALAKEWDLLKDYPKAIALYEQLKASDPMYVGLYYHLAQCYIETENREKALTTYDEGIQCAKKINDFHALSELVNAKTNASIEW